MTSFGDVVLIERDGWDLLISPQDPQQFIADMNVSFSFLFLVFERN